MLQDLALLWPEIIVLLTGVAALSAEMLRAPRAAYTLSVLGLAVATVATLPLLDTQAAPFGGTLRVDALAVWAKLILLPATLLILTLTRAELKGSDREGTAYALLCFTLLGSLVLADAGDLMFLVLGVLLTSLGSFALVAYPRTDPATEAAMKYFVYGTVTGGIMLFGLTYWFGAVGETLLSDLGALERYPLVGAFGLTAVLVGLGYKASLVPFHFWAPDAYEGGPVAVAAFLSVVPKIGALVALAVVIQQLPASLNGPAILALVAALTMTYGNLAALRQNNVVRLLAYSSIAQSGYFLLALVALGRSGWALDALVVFAAAYAAMNVGAFAVVLRVGATLEAFAGVGRFAPLLGAAMVIFLLSLVGVPPLAGFVGKLLLFGAALDAGFIALAVVAIINSVLSLAVYLRIVVPLYRRATPRPLPGPATRTAVAVCAVATVGLGLAAQIVLAW